MADQSISFGSHNVQTLIKNSPNSHIYINQRETARLFVPPFRREPDAQRGSEFDLLLPKYAITEMVGRAELWRDCLTWCEDAAPVSIRCITGRAGFGKTRFALELVHYLRSLEPWDARFVDILIPEPFDLRAKTAGDNHMLLVFDQAGDVIGTLAPSLRLLAIDPPPESAGKLRVLLLARHADWDEGWLSTLRPRSSNEESVRDLFRPDDPIALTPLDNDDRRMLYQQALKAVAKFTGLPEPPEPGPEFYSQPRTRAALRDPLTVLMAAVTAVRSAIPDPFALTSLSLAHEVAELLASGLATALPDNPQLARHMAAFFTLCGGMSREAAQDALASEARANNMGVILNPGDFIDRLRAFLPGEETEIGPILPDIVAEAFILGKSEPRLRKPEDTLLRALALGREPVVNALVRMTQDFCLAEDNAREEPLRWLERVMEKGFADDLALLRNIEAALPDSTVVLRRQAVAVTGVIVQRLSQMVVQGGSDAGVHVMAEIAAMLHNLGARLNAWGVPAAALSSSRDAVSIYRRLAAFDRAYLSYLATALSGLAGNLGSVGRLPEALTAAQEAVALCRDLVGQRREAWLRILLHALTTLSNRQTALGLTSQSLASAQEATALAREAVELDRDRYLTDLALTLIVQSGAQSEEALRKEALASAEEAVSLRRQLVQRNRDAFLPDLAFALVRLSVAQGDRGLSSEGVASAAEAVLICRQLVRHSPGSFLPELASALETYSLQQGEAGNRKEALISAQEANRVYRKLVEYNRAAYLPGLAGSLTNLTKALTEAGQSHDAIPAVREAVSLWRELTQENRWAYLPQLAQALNNQAAAEMAVGLWTNVLDTQAEAIALLRELSAQDRRAYAPGLALTLTTQAGLFSAFGKREEAVEAAAEAVELLSEMERDASGAFAPELTRALVNYGRALGDSGNVREAAATFQVAVDRARALVSKNREAHLADLAMALNNLSAMQGAMQLPDAMYKSASEAFSLYEELSQLFGDTHGIERARSLNNTAVALHTLGSVDKACMVFAYALTDLLALHQNNSVAMQLAQLLLSGYVSTCRQLELTLKPELVKAAAAFISRNSAPQEEDQ